MSQSTVNALTSELHDLRAQLEEAAVVHAQEVKRLQEQARELGKQHESCVREVSFPGPCWPYTPAVPWKSGEGAGEQLTSPICEVSEQL